MGLRPLPATHRARLRRGGDGLCLIFMTGARKGWPDKGIVCPRSELALRHGAGVERETTLPAEAYAPFPRWRPGPPGSWTGLPWA
jgi:hypothetical protein